jgi:hypothetical protein
VRKPAFYLALIGVIGVGGPLGWQVARVLAAPDDRSTYRALDPNVYYPNFFKQFAQARTRGAAWVLVPPEMALAYVGRTRVCPDQQISSLPVEDGRKVFIITRTCPYSRMVVRQYRLEMIERDGAGEIEWAGMRLKCAVNQSPVGAYLVNHNPFAARFAWAMPINKVVRSFANTLNLWMPECP